MAARFAEAAEYENWRQLKHAQELDANSFKTVFEAFVRARRPRGDPGRHRNSFSVYSLELRPRVETSEAAIDAR